MELVIVIAGWVAEQLMRAVLADRDAAGSDDDLLAMVGDADPPALPNLYICRGTEDPLVASSREFVEIAERRGDPSHVVVRCR